MGQSEWHDVAVVVIGVLANQIDAARGGPDASWFPSNPGKEVLNQGVGVVAHLTHCIGREVLITSADGLRK